MNCDQAQILLSTQLDQQIEAADAASLDEHLDGCADCRQLRADWQQQARALEDAFRPARERGQRLADRVVADLAADAMLESSARSTTSVARPVQMGWARQLSIVAASLAVGFALACFIFQPWRAPTTITHVLPPTPQPPVAVIPTTTIGRLVAATGDVEYLPEANAEWMDRCGTDPAALRLGCSVRTKPKVVCELALDNGCTLRLNESTELAVESAEKVVLVKGQVWCQAPKDALLVVSNGMAVDPLANDPAHAWTVQCPTNSASVTQVEKQNVLVADGMVELQMAQGTKQVKGGETASIQDGVVKKPSQLEILQATNWMTPLMMQKGLLSDEIDSRVNQMLVNIGQAKASFFYERDIRQLGEYGAVPLLKYVKSEQSRDERSRRRFAMRIAADTAPSWSVGDLIDLLNDEDGEVRYFAALGLERITRETHNYPMERWKSSSPEQSGQQEKWNSWWTRNRDKFPKPPNY